MEKLTRNGQAILCTIHQPSSLLFQRFDRLLLLAKGGKTVYFGEIGHGSKTLVDYFVRNGGPPCAPGANPAEYMLEVIGAAPGSHTEVDWPATWRASPEHNAVRAELTRLREHTNRQASLQNTDEGHQSFAAPFITQLELVTLRCAQQYWRTPSYIWSKMVLTVGCSFIIGFSFFNAENTQQGLQNQMFGVFIFLFVVLQLLFQIIPMFVVQRTLYEARERQSKTYAWQAFVLSNIVIEMFWNSVSNTCSSQATLTLTSLLGCSNFLFLGLVLPSRTLPQRRIHRRGQYPRLPHLVDFMGHVPFRKLVSTHADRRCGQRSNSLIIRIAHRYHAVRILRHLSRTGRPRRFLDLHVSR